jgi:superfamily II DNA helicase RecQ
VVKVKAFNALSFAAVDRPNRQNPKRYVDSRGRTRCGIIYCLSRNDAETLAGKLADLPQPRSGRNGGRLQVT